jgi:hypothetical protein
MEQDLLAPEDITAHNAYVFQRRARSHVIHLCVLYSLIIGAAVGYLIRGYLG